MPSGYLLKLSRVNAPQSVIASRGHFERKEKRLCQGIKTSAFTYHKLTWMLHENEKLRSAIKVLMENSSLFFDEPSFSLSKTRVIESATAFHNCMKRLSRFKCDYWFACFSVDDGSCWKLKLHELLIMKTIEFQFHQKRENLLSEIALRVVAQSSFNARQRPQLQTTYAVYTCFK